MPFIPINMNDVHESKPVGQAMYDLQITAVDEAKTKAGADQLIVSLAIEGHDDAPNVRHYVGLPGNGDDPDKAKFKTLLLKRFCTMFKVPFKDNGFDTDALLGARAKAELTLSEPDDNGNIYNRLVVPRLREEGSPTAGGSNTQGSSTRKPPKS